MLKRMLCALSIVTLVVAAVGCGNAKDATSAGTEGTLETAITENTGSTLPADVTGSITVGCYDAYIEKPLLEEAAAAFMTRYPGTDVNVEAFSAMPEIMQGQSGDSTYSSVEFGDDAQARSDYLTRVNTELMSGGGADVLAMDILPWYRYAENKRLENLRPYMEADTGFEMADYPANIMDAFLYNGAQYVMPLDYSFRFFSYNNALCDAETKQLIAESGYTYEQLSASNTAAFDNNANAETPVRMFDKDKLGLFEALFNERYTQFVDISNRTAHVNDGTFAGLLETVRNYATRGYMSDTSDYDPEIDADMVAYLMRRINEPFFVKSFSVPSLLQFFYTDPNNGGIAPGYTRAEEDRVAGQAQDADGYYPFSSAHAYGINANSGNKSTAWAFVRFLLDIETQTSSQIYGGLPVLTAARAIKTKEEITGAWYDPSINPDALNDEQQAAFDAYMETLEAWTARLNRYALRDETVDAMVTEETSRFFAGERSADETAAALQNRISLYLGE